MFFVLLYVAMFKCERPSGMVDWRWYCF